MGDFDMMLESSYRGYAALTVRLAWSEWSRFTLACVRTRNVELCQQVADLWSAVSNDNAQEYAPNPSCSPQNPTVEATSSSSDSNTEPSIPAAGIVVAFARRRRHTACINAIAVWRQFTVDRTKYRSRLVSRQHIVGLRLRLRAFRQWAVAAQVLQLQKKLSAAEASVLEAIRTAGQLQASSAVQAQVLRTTSERMDAQQLHKQALQEQLTAEQHVYRQELEAQQQAGQDALQQHLRAQQKAQTRQLKNLKRAHVQQLQEQSAMLQQQIDSCCSQLEHERQKRVEDNEHAKVAQQESINSLREEQRIASAAERDSHAQAMAKVRWQAVEHRAAMMLRAGLQRSYFELRVCGARRGARQRAINKVASIAASQHAVQDAALVRVGIRLLMTHWRAEALSASNSRLTVDLAERSKSLEICTTELLECRSILLQESQRGKCMRERLAELNCEATLWRCLKKAFHGWRLVPEARRCERELRRQTQILALVTAAARNGRTNTKDAL